MRKNEDYLHVLCCNNPTCVKCRGMGQYVRLLNPYPFFEKEEEFQEVLYRIPKSALMMELARREQAAMRRIKTGEEIILYHRGRSLPVDSVRGPAIMFVMDEIEKKPSE